MGTQESPNVKRLSKRKLSSSVSKKNEKTTRVHLSDTSCTSNTLDKNSYHLKDAKSEQVFNSTVTQTLQPSLQLTSKSLNVSDTFISKGIKRHKDEKTEGSNSEPPPPPSQMHPNSDDVVNIFAKQVEIEADVMDHMAKKNATACQPLFESMHLIPIQNWSSTKSSCFQSLVHQPMALDTLRNAFEEDYAYLKTRYLQVFQGSFDKTTHSHVSQLGEQFFKKESKDHEEDGKTRSIKEFKKEKKKFKMKNIYSTLNHADEHIYTDDDEELHQQNFRFPACIRPLRSIIGKLKKRKKLHKQLEDNSNLKKNEYKTEIQESLTDVKSHLRNNSSWREWDRAVQLCWWFSFWKPFSLLPSLCESTSKTIPLHLSKTDSTKCEFLKNFQVINNAVKLPECKLAQALLLNYVQTLPFVRDSEALSQLDNSFSVSENFSILRSPLQWTILNSDKLLSEDVFNCIKQKKSYSINWCTPGERFYVGRLEAFWGSPVAEGYPIRMYLTEFGFWFSRSTKPFTVLDAYFSPARKYKPKKYRNFDEKQAEVLTSALSFHTEEPFDMSVRVFNENDSSDSSSETIPVHSTLSLTMSSFNMPSIENHIVRIGRFNKLKPSWTEERKRKRNIDYAYPEAEQVNDMDSHAFLDSSSEDSCMAYKESQRFYRQRRRAERKKIELQKNLVAELSTECVKKKLNKKQNMMLSKAFEHDLGPVDPPFVYPDPSNILQTNVGFTHINKKPVDRNKCASTNDCQNGDERWTYIMYKKPRVKKIESTFLHESKAPLGFFCKTTNVADKKYNFLAINQNELWRQYGGNKKFYKQLFEYSDLLKGCREYYVIIDEAKQQFTIVPGASLSIFWTKTAKQNLLDMHWYFFWKNYSVKRFQIRLLKKLQRYQYLQNQGWFIWKKKLDQLRKIEDRLREASAFSNAKQTRLTTRYFSGLPEQVRDSPVNTTYCEPVEVHTLFNLMDNLSPTKNLLVNEQAESLQDNLEINNDTNTSSDIEDSYIESILECNAWKLDASKVLSKLLKTRVSPKLDAQIHASLSTSLPNSPKVPYWMWSKEIKKSLSVRFANCYGPLISHYYRKTLPAFTATYRKAREIMGAKLQAELESMNKSKHAHYTTSEAKNLSTMS